MIGGHGLPRHAEFLGKSRPQRGECGTRGGCSRPRATGRSLEVDGQADEPSQGIEHPFLIQGRRDDVPHSPPVNCRIRPGFPSFRPRIGSCGGVDLLRPLFHVRLERGLDPVRIGWGGMNRDLEQDREQGGKTDELGHGPEHGRKHGEMKSKIRGCRYAGRTAGRRPGPSHLPPPRHRANWMAVPHGRPSPPPRSSRSRETKSARLGSHPPPPHWPR